MDKYVTYDLLNSILWSILWVVGWFCIGLLISQHGRIISGWKRRIISNLVRSIVDLQDNFFIINIMIKDMSDYIPKLNQEYPFFDGINQPEFNLLKTSADTKIHYLFELYNAVMEPVYSNIEQNKADFSFHDLRTKKKITKMLSKYLNIELTLLSRIYRNMIIIRYITENKNIEKMTELNNAIKYRFEDINGVIKAYNALNKNRES